jgi:hypothetical protein
MRTIQLYGSSAKFWAMQLTLLVITVALTVLFTVPLVKTVGSSMHYCELSAKFNDTNKEIETLQNQIDEASSIKLMSPQVAGDTEASEKLMKQVEEFRRQMELKELENKQLRDEMALVQTMLRILNAKTVSADPPTMDFWHKLADISTKVLGFIGSLFSGGMFALAWWRARRKPKELNVE